MLLVAAVLGCNGSVAEGGADAGRRSDAGAARDARTASDDGGNDAAYALDGAVPSSDGGAPPPFEVPGGPPGTAPVVGCTEADRPARRLAAPVESCDAVGDGRCFYIDPDGADAGDGSFASPFRSPQAAVRRAGPGDVIYLRGGVYDDDNAHDAAPRVWADSSQGTIRGIVSVANVRLPSWAGATDYRVASGTEAAPIVVRSFPGERACIDGAGSIRVGSLVQETAHWRFEDITLRRGGFLIGGGAGSGARFVNQTHDIDVRRMEISHLEGNEGDNTGLIRIDRGDWGGPYDIEIESNIFHHLYVRDRSGVRHEPTDGHDALHFAAVTVLSCETYLGAACGGNGSTVARNNHIYQVPSAFFLKNPALGPFTMSGNVIHGVASLGGWSPANITFEQNLVWDLGSVPLSIGGFGGGVTDEPVWERAGRNLAIRNNTIIGVDNLLYFRLFASGHTIRGNVIQGLTWSLSVASRDRPGAIVADHPYLYPDPAADIADSRLAMDNDFDDNCYVTPVADFIAYGRRSQVSGAPLRVEVLGLDQARTSLGYDLSSDRVGDPAEVFEGFAAGDYRIRATGPCAGRGASVPPWGPAR